MLLAISVAVFLGVISAVGVAGYWLWIRDSSTVGAAALAAGDPGWQPPSEPLGPQAPGWLTVLAQIGENSPFAGEDRQKVRRRLAAAGYRQGWALQVFFGAKALGLALAPALCCALAMLSGAAFGTGLALALLGAYIGLKTPDRALRRIMRKRREAVRRGLPDFLDLLVVAVESGLSLDHAIVETARDLGRAHPELSDELGLFTREVQAGTSRAEALRNLGARCGEPELRKLASLLIQTDRFGSSISKVLRTQARYMRIKRRQRAEEMAHKVGVKTIFPIFLLIMPSVFLVTAGPAVIMLVENFSRMAAGE